MKSGGSNGTYPALKDYEIVGFLGQGQFGSVHKVKSKTSGQVYACKLMRYENMSRKEKQLLHSEINLHKKLSHPNIVQYYRTILSEETREIYLLTEFCGKGDLLKFIREYPQKLIPENTIWNIMGQLLLALEYCHSPSKPGFDYGTVIIHRDIKPANVLIRDDGCIKLCDFGFSRACTSGEMAATVLGSPMYTAPELFRRQPYDCKADIWSLGCVIHHVCTRAVPFVATTKDALMKQILDGQRTPLPSQYSKELVKFLDGMVSQNPEKRPSAAELLQHPKFREVGVIHDHDEPVGQEKAPEITNAIAALAAKDAKIEELQTQLVDQAKTIQLLESKKGSGQDAQKVSDELVNTRAQLETAQHDLEVLRAIAASRAETIMALRAQQTLPRVVSQKTDLMLAAKNGDIELVKTLREEAGMRTLIGETALMLAAENGHEACVRLLLNEEAGLQDIYGGTAIMRAAMGGHSSVVTLLQSIEMGMIGASGETALMYAAFRGHPECVQLLLVGESKCQMDDGTTALMWAVLGNSIPCITKLLEPEIALRRRGGEDAIDLAKRLGYTHLLDVLQRKWEHGTKN
ncbi:Kinase, NEK [Giardia muris]|uniref:non-specific serine/threonine protein kinase n=1 Tax=Giardia muris TaxID=5742 RepID=A0A4Z1SPS3_GIAMU|nr:Kinase, NEK [Giardia muris]|eukprot:TNJ27660.1 Kinase, NEK [Giardia muris]